MLKQFSEKQRHVRRLWRMSWKDKQQWRILVGDSGSLVLCCLRQVIIFSNWNNDSINKVHAKVEINCPRLHQPHSPHRLFHPLTSLTIPLMKLLLPDFLMKRLLTFKKSEINFFRILKEGSS